MSILRWKDQDLGNYAACPLYDPVLSEDRIQATSEQLLHWALGESFLGRRVLLTLDTLRQRFTYFWKKGWPAEVAMDCPEFWQGVRTGNKMAKQIFLLVQRNRVIRPMEPYTWIYKEHHVHGKYAVIQREGRYIREFPVVFIPVQSVAKEITRPLLPDLVKYLHAAMEGDYAGLGLLYFPLLHGRPRKYFDIRERLALDWVQSILQRMAAETRFPAPGRQCFDCASQRCMEVFTIRQFSQLTRPSRLPSPTKT